MLAHHWERNESSIDPSPANNSSDGDNELVTVSIIFIILNTVFVILRCYARSLTKATYGWDDYLIFASLTFNIASCVLSIVVANNSNAARAKEVLALELTYLASVSLPKLSALCFYIRVFVYRKARIIASIVIGFIILNWVVFSITAMVQCKPFAYFWNKTIQGGICFDSQPFLRAMSVPNIATDIIILALSITPLTQLTLPLFKKIALCFIFLTGSVGMFASIYRLSLFLTADTFTDLTYATIFTWGIVESGMYLIAACLPFLRPVIKKVIPERLLSFPRSSENNSSKYSTNRAAPFNSTKLEVPDKDPDDLEMG